MSKFRNIFQSAAHLLMAAVVAATVGMITIAGPGVETAMAQQSGEVPGRALGAQSDAEFWRAVREGQQFTVSIPDKKAGVMIQSEGENWRNARNGPIANLGSWILVGMVVWLALFFAVRGRIKIDSGFSGKLIERFNSIERFGHWLTACSFIVLALTGLNVMYGRYLFGKSGESAGDFGAVHQFFAFITYYGKLLHSYVAFAFMAGVVMIFVLWVKDNIPQRVDIK